MKSLDNASAKISAELAYRLDPNDINVVEFVDATLELHRRDVERLVRSMRSITDLDISTEELYARLKSGRDALIPFADVPEEGNAI